MVTRSRSDVDAHLLRRGSRAPSVPAAADAMRRCRAKRRRHIEKEVEASRWRHALWQRAENRYAAQACADARCPAFYVCRRRLPAPQRKEERVKTRKPKRCLPYRHAQRGRRCTCVERFAQRRLRLYVERLGCTSLPSIRARRAPRRRYCRVTDRESPSPRFPR